MHGLETDTERIATLIMHLAARSRVVWTPDEGSNKKVGSCTTELAGRKILLRWDTQNVFAEIHEKNGALFIRDSFDSTTSTWDNARAIIDRTVSDPGPTESTDLDELIAAVTTAPEEIHEIAPTPPAPIIAPVAHVEPDAKEDLPEPASDELPEPAENENGVPSRLSTSRLVINAPPAAAQSTGKGKRSQARAAANKTPEKKNGSSSGPNRSRGRIYLVAAVVLFLAAGFVGYAYFSGMGLPGKDVTALVAQQQYPALATSTPDPALKGTSFRTASGPVGNPDIDHPATEPPEFAQPKPHTVLHPLNRPPQSVVKKTHESVALVVPTPLIKGLVPPVRGQNDPHMANSIGHKPPMAPMAVSYEAIDDNPGDGTGGGFDYNGTWDHLENMHDGRTNGTSSRSFHEGDSATLPFTGRHLRIYAVAGPQGGYATLRIDGKVEALLNFYAPTKTVHDLIYTTPALPAGEHEAVITVNKPDPENPKHRFVNLDGAEYAAT